MADIKDILSGEDQLSEEELLKYLQGNLSDEEKHKVEKKLADSPFLNDAVEGLQEFDNKQKLDEYVKQLNKNLQQQLLHYKARKDKRRLKDNTYTTIAIIIILGLCLIAYIVIQMQSR